MPRFRPLGLLACIALAACSTGRDFHRPDLAPGIQIGRTSQADIVSLYGQPARRAETQSSGQPPLTPLGFLPTDQTTLVYAYSERSDFVDALARSSRLAIFGLQDGILRSVIYVSDFPADQPVIDPHTVESLLATPRVTRADFIAALGPPQAVVTAKSLPIAEVDGWYAAVKGPRVAIRIPQATLTRLLVVGFGKDGAMASHKFETRDQ